MPVYRKVTVAGRSLIQSFVQIIQNGDTRGEDKDEESEEKESEEEAEEKPDLKRKGEDEPAKVQCRSFASTAALANKFSVPVYLSKLSFVCLKVKYATQSDALAKERTSETRPVNVYI